MKNELNSLCQQLSQAEMLLLINKWYQQISTHKRDLVKHALNQRTKYVTVALEDVFQPFNASAIVRTTEIFGLQDLHVITPKNEFRPSIGISRGAIKWLTIKQYNDTPSCIETLKQNGYLIAATCLNEQSIALDQLPINQRIALLFGNELVGLSSDTIKQADMTVHIPMFGFTKSFNVSVSVAICLQHIVNKIRSSTIAWRLNQEERVFIEYMWCKQLTQRK